MSIIGILFALALLMFLVYKKVNIVVASVICCIIVSIAGQLPIVTSITGDYMTGFSTFVTNNYLIFAFSALFGKIMEDTGAASAFAKLMYKAFGAKYAIYGCMLATALLIYGGVSNFVVVFTVYPIFLSVFKEANLPIKLIPGVIFAAAVTFAASMLPGTPSLNNIIPTQYIDTTPMAAPIPGIVASIVTIICIFFYFEYEFKRARQKGERFEANEKVTALISRLESKKEVNPWLALLPMVALVVSLNAFKLNILIALVISIVLALILFYKNIDNVFECVNEGIGSAGSAILNTSAAVGFGNVVKATAGFQTIVNGLSNVGGNPMISLGLITTLISGVTGSGTGGVGIAMQVFAEKYLQMGVHPEILHRIISIASNGLDSLPHNGLVITVIVTCGCTHKESYKPIFVTSVVITIIALAVTILMGMGMYPIIPLS